MGRSILGFLAGAIVAMCVIAAVEGLSSLMHPMPEGMDPRDTQQVRDFVATLPPSAFAMVILAWSLGALAGGWLAGRIAGRSTGIHGMTVGLLLMLGAIVNMALIPGHPGWVWAGGILLPPAFGYLGGWLARPARPARPDATAGAAPVQG